MVFADSLTGGIIGGTIAAVLIALLCVAVSVGGFIWAAAEKGKPYGDRGTARFIGWAGIAGVVLTAALWTFQSWPLSYEYHHWIDKTGRVEAVNNRLLTDSDGGIQQKFVVRMNGSYYGINDTRASLLKEGSVVHLRCKRAFQWGIPREAHGWDCRWAGVTS